MLVILLITLILIAYGIFEYRAHQSNLRAIPIRVHVNGTRGKSSVTRLVAAALRAGGYNTFAKTTGTLPRIIDNEGLEVPILRPHRANIIEQVKIIRYIRKRQPEAMVVECMAVQPEYQWICEHRMVKSGVGIITNSRADHLREMGPTLEHVTRSLMNTLPHDGVVFTAEKKYFNLIEKEAQKRKLGLHKVDTSIVPLEVMSNFDHLEHRENVALALAVARHFDIADDVALAGMYYSHPDVGALRLYRVEEGGKTVRFVNALAANDPESTLSTWRKVREIYTDPGKIIVLLNTRADRFDRSRQLLWMAANYVKYDYIVSIGEKTSLLAQYYRRYKVDPSKVLQLGMTTCEAVYHKIFELIKGDALVLAIGNMGAGGFAVANYFRDRSIAKEKQRG